MHPQAGLDCVPFLWGDALMTQNKPTRVAAFEHPFDPVAAALAAKAAGKDPLDPDWDGT